MMEENQHYVSTTTIAAKKFAFFSEANHEQCELLYARIFTVEIDRRTQRIAATIYQMLDNSTQFFVVENYLVICW